LSATAYNFFTNSPVTLARDGTSRAEGERATVRAFAVRVADNADGSNPARPLLAPDDVGFVDTQGGWGWSERCYRHLLKGKWAWAKAECDSGLALNPARPEPRAALLYNEGLIARAAGHFDEARANFSESLSLKVVAEVRAALDSVK
jgi:hypothetical protein